ncbi:MAG: insulinase family protein [Pirellulales bacterium]|nr:insulinase family protein [Pirellulales bacterium]
MKQVYSIIVVWLLAGCMTLAFAEDIIPTYTPAAQLEIPAPQLPEMYHTTLDNGLCITTIPQHEVPTVSFMLAIGSGALSDPEGKEGTASLTASLLDRGTINRTGDEIAAELDFMATSVSGYTDWYNTYIRSGCLTKYMTETLEIFGEVLLHPVFPVDELDKIRTRAISSLQQRLDSPKYLASRGFSGAIYAGSRYALQIHGEMETLPQITQADIVEFYNSFYSPANAEMIIVGDVDHATVVKLVEQHLGAWQRPAVSRVILTTPPSPEEPGVILVNKPDATNASFRFGHLGVKRNNPDFYSLQVMNHILGGGGFSSRLMQRIRSELGYTYGIYSNFWYERDTGVFCVNAAVTPENLQNSITEALAIFDGIRRELVTEQELRDAANYMAASYLLNFEDSNYLARKIIQSHTYDLPENAIVDYPDNILAVTREDILRVAKAYLAPERFQYVFVGNAEQLRSQAEIFGTLSIREID